MKIKNAKSCYFSVWYNVRCLKYFFFLEMRSFKQFFVIFVSFSPPKEENKVFRKCSNFKNKGSNISFFEFIFKCTTMHIPTSYFGVFSFFYGDAVYKSRKYFYLYVCFSIGMFYIAIFFYICSYFSLVKNSYLYFDNIHIYL